MNILTVEDDSFKYSKIEELVLSVMPDARIKKCENVHDAVIYLNSVTPDKIILDMSLPSHSAMIGKGSPLSMPSGGIEIIFELSSMGKRGIPIIILTQYPEIELEDEYYAINEAGEVLKNLCDIDDLAVILYVNDSEDWKEQTIEFLRK